MLYNIAYNTRYNTKYHIIYTKSYKITCITH